MDDNHAVSGRSNRMRGRGGLAATMASALRRAGPWLAPVPHDAEAVALLTVARAALNLARLRLVLPALGLLHWALALLVRLAQERGGESFLLEPTMWRHDVTTANLVMGLVALGLGGLAWIAPADIEGNAREWQSSLPSSAASLYLVLAAWVTGIDQQLAPSVTAFMIACFGVALIVRLPGRTSLRTFGLSWVALLFFIAVYQPSPSLRLSAVVNGTAVAALGQLLSWILERAFVRDVVNRRMIDAQRRELVATNQELSTSLELLRNTNAELEREAIVRAAAERELERLAVRDPLTGLANRRRFLELAEHEARRSSARPGLSLAMVDVDHFKAINDSHGHAVGDTVLREVAKRCSEVVRDRDVVGRLGGDEFAVLFVGCSLDEAGIIAQRLRVAVSWLEVPSRAGPLRLTVSVGLTDLLATENAIELAMQRADDALYDAKRAGRNRVITRAGAPPPDDQSTNPGPG